MVVEKVINGFIIAGSLESIKHFISQLDSRFELGKFTIKNSFTFLGCKIYRNASEDVTMDTKEYSNRLLPLLIEKTRQNQLKSLANDL